MDLDRAWKIGLAEIQYTHSWYSVMNNEAWLKVHFHKESELQKHLVLLLLNKAVHKVMFTDLTVKL
jgi:hypothetical protein